MKRVLCWAWDQKPYNYNMEKLHNIVYKRTNDINGKIYVGTHSTNNLDDGYIGCGIYCDAHSKLNRYKNSPFHNAVAKYGKDNFSREILCDVETAELAYFIESLIVDEDFIAREDTYNVALGGVRGPMLGKTHPMKGKKTGRPSPMKGIPKTEESKEKNRIAHLGKPSPMKGKTLPKDHPCREKMSLAKQGVYDGDKNPMYGKRFYGEENPNFGNKMPQKSKDIIAMKAVLRQNFTYFYTLMTITNLQEENK